MKCFIFQQGASETQINCNQIHLYETTYKPHKQNAKINKTVMELGRIGEGSGSKLNIFTAHLLFSFVYLQNGIFLMHLSILKDKMFVNVSKPSLVTQCCHV